MKLATFTVDEGPQHIGAVIEGDCIVDFTAPAPASASGSRSVFASMLDLIEAGDTGLMQARELLQQRRVVHGLQDVRLLAPLPRPVQMRDFLCFEKHFRQARANGVIIGAASAERDPSKVQLPAIWYEEPIYYKGNRMSVVGPGAEIVIPRYTRMLDFELEFGIVLGKGGKDIDREDALSHVFGYTIFNDFSARDQQVREMQGTLGPTKSKDFDGGNVLGPYLVTADEIPNPYQLTMTARVNGVQWGQGNSSAMHHKFEDILVHVSKNETVYPGEFFGSGTVGDGCGLEHGRFLEAGDVVELEVQGLGVLSNRVVANGLCGSDMARHHGHACACVGHAGSLDGLDKRQAGELGCHSPKLQLGRSARPA
jgi:2-keto-4-pentenoate hydratase/2-oxohepta-3-ene-1,7-dioic acid hydratase in catechol pathway